MEKSLPTRNFRVVFAGSPAYAIPSLEALLALPGCSVVGVLTQKPKPRGRGNQLHASAIGVFAEAHNLLTLTPNTLRVPEAHALLTALKADVGVVVAYGKILPQAVLNLLPQGWVNAHASLLPRWRGASPIQQTIAAGDVETGVSLMQLDAGMDTGPILVQERLPVAVDETAVSLAEKLSQLSGMLIRKHLRTYLDGTLLPQPQPVTGVTLAPQLTKADGHLHFGEAALQLVRKVRAFNPWPGAVMQVGTLLLKILTATTAPGQEQPGKIVRVPTGFGVGTPQQLFIPLQVQVPGKKPMSAAEFFHGYNRLLTNDVTGPKSSPTS
ncbi:MAG: methionyl-tRNA formyltransferase [Patescibacteria group bacterium]